MGCNPARQASAGNSAYAGGMSASAIFAGEALPRCSDYSFAGSNWQLCTRAPHSARNPAGDDPSAPTARWAALRSFNTTAVRLGNLHLPPRHLYQQDASGLGGRWISRPAPRRGRRYGSSRAQAGLQQGCPLRQHVPSEALAATVTESHHGPSH